MTATALPPSRQRNVFHPLSFAALLLGASAAPEALGQSGGLQFDGSNDYVTFGQASGLGLSTFTLEGWVQRTGAGVTTSSGSGGITAVPLITKGRSESDGSNLDCNYFLGLRTGDFVLTADFEAFGTGANNPVAGVTPLALNTWYHVAATYDGTSWALYLNGVLETNLVSGQTPRYDSIQHGGLGTAINSSGVAAGYFAGTLDEVRIWNHARSAAQISSNRNRLIVSDTGLVGRWSLDEGTGTTAGNTGSSGLAGTLVNGPVWTNGYPFYPSVSLTQPAPGAVFSGPLDLLLQATASDVGGSVTNVAFRAGATLLGQVSTSPFEWTWTNAPLGFHALTAVATDDTGLMSTSAVSAVSIHDPAVQLTSPTNGALLLLPGSTTLTATVPETNGPVSQVEFFSGSSSLAVLAAAPWSYVWTPTATGAQTLTAVATDASGTHTSAPVAITVAVRTPPTASLTSPTNNARLLIGSNITLSATAADSDGSITQVAFYTNGVLLSLDTTAPYSTIWSNAPEGIHSLTLVATDNDGLTNEPSVVTVTVGTNTPPVISLTYPAHGASLLSGTNLTITASASDAEVAVTNVEFYLDGWRMRSDTTAPYSWTWSNAPLGSFILTARATDSLGSTNWSDPVSITVSFSSSGTNVLITQGSAWHYRDNGVYPGANWTTPTYDDSSWAEGLAELGYGDGDEATVVSYGPNSAAKYITTWFRRRFVVSDPAAYGAMQVFLRRDDGAVVYLNGVEVARQNMPAGTITATTPASAVTSSETAFFTSSFGTEALLSGTNVLAVEVHQDSANSSDISFDLRLAGLSGDAVRPNVMRGPYLQNATPQGVVVRWRTDLQAPSQLRYGTNPASLDQVLAEGTFKTEHLITVSNLLPDTRYYYAIESGTNLLAGNAPDFYFTTLCLPGANRSTRLWILGDSGTADANARSVRNAYTNLAAATRPADLWLMLGDNAYDVGSDTEYQAAVFDLYPTVLRNTTLWSTIGNHETAQSTTAASFPYLDIFTLPQAGEAGGLPSGTERYYSFDYANVHFLCLDAMTSGRTTNTTMFNWVINDLQSTTQEWVIAFWHHPPYTKGSHNSDTESDLVAIRQNWLPVLESYGVDLVLSGHSHCYERSFLMKGHFGLSSTITPSMKLDPGDGRPAGAGAYVKSHGNGTVYVVAGNGGKATGGTLNHPAMYLSLNEIGSLVIDVSSNRLDLQMLGPSAVRDTFTLIKQPPLPPTITLTNPANLASIPTPGVLSLAAESTDPDGTVTRVDFFTNGVWFATVTNTPYTVSWTNPPAGLHTLTASATDDEGQTNLSEAVIITAVDVEDPSIICPTILSVAASPGSCSSNVTFSASATDNTPGVTVACSPASGSAFSTGSTTVSCTATDAAGNTNTCSFSVTVTDTEAPTVTCPVSLSVATSGGVCTSNVTFSASVTDNCSGASVTCSPASGSAFATGTTTVTCTGTDAAGNTNSCSFSVTVTDIEPPTVTCPANLSVTTSGGVCSSNVTFSASVTDNCSGASVTCSPASGSAFSTGSTTVSCIATDAAGNTNTCSFSVTVADTEAPSVTCPSDINVSAPPGTCSSNVTFSASVTDNCPGASVTCSPASGSAFSTGTTTVTCSASDAAGNTNSCSFSVTVSDTEAPTVTCPVSLSVATSGGICTSNVTFSASVTDNCSGASVTCAPASGSAFSTGSTIVTCTATDAAGNTNTCSFSVTVTDIEPPTVTCPANLSVTTSSGVCTSNVTFSASVTDNCSGASVTCAPASGSAFSTGSTTVSCIATDATGNTNTCSFSVTVADTEAPSVTCPSDINVSAPPGTCSSNVTFSASVTDNCPGASVTCSPASGSAFSTGTTTVTCSASDAAGNTNSCSFSVTVSDTEAPTVTCPGNLTVSTSTGSCASNVTFSASVTDNCSGASVICAPASGSAFTTGTTPVTCTATDAAGNTNTCSFSVTVADTEAPSVTCPSDINVNAPPGICTSNVTFSASVIDNCSGASVTCSPASGSAFTTGTTPITCTATDAAGNTNTCSFSVTVSDTEAPTVTCPGNLTVSTSTGSCASNVTFSASVTDNCSGASVTCAPASGSAFATGTTPVTCIATDAAGNTNTCSFSVTVSDTEAPTVTCPGNLTVSTSTGSCASNVTFSASVTDNCAGASVTCSPASGSAFSTGTTTVSCTATDAAGNTNSCSFSVTVSDTEAPTVTCPSNLTVSTSTGSCASNVTFSASVTDNCSGASVTCSPASGSAFTTGTTPITCTATDAAGNTNTCSFSVTVADTEAPAVTCPSDITVSAPPGTCTSNVTFSASTTDNCSGASVTCSPASGSAFTTGATPITCTATDAAGNTNTCSFSVTVSDTEAPTVTCPGNLTVSTSTGSCASNVTFSASVTDNCSGASVTCAPASGSAFATGTTPVTCIATDAAGNTNTCSFSVTVSDTEAPMVTCPGNLTVSTSTGSCASNVTFSASVTDNCAGASVTCSPASGSAFSTGSTIVTCTATDAAGNTNTCSFSVTVSDTEAPTVTCPSDINVSAPPGICTSNVTFSASVTDNCSGASVTCSPASGSAFSTGTTTVSCTATDAAGNTNTCSFSVTVADTEAPAVTCPSDITVSAPPGTCTSNVTFSASVIDNCSGASVTCAPASGSAFSTGTTTVTCTATDAAGNTNTCSFSVTVSDTEAPTVTCPGNLTVSTSTGSCASNVTFSASVTDNCSGASVTCAPASGSAFATGTTTVTCTGTDAAGNTNSCSFSVTVTDIEPPTVTCPANLSVTTSGGVCSSNVTFSASVTDNCSGASVTCSPASGSAFSTGSTTVSCIATDAAGNTNTCSFSVTVADTEAPSVTCPSDINVSAPPGTCSSNVTFSASVTDNCPGASVTCSPASGSAFSTGTTTVTCSASDAAGNTNSCSFSVTVSDTEAPTVTCPANITLSASTGSCSSNITFSASVTDNCSGASVICAPASGSAFSTGTTTVSCTATDAAGNTNSCSFSVTVSDTEAPTVTCPSNLTVSTSTGSCSSNITFSASVTDNCSGASVICAPASGSAFSTGTTTVSCTATDAAGNTNSCSFSVTVSDTEAPTVTCPSNLTVSTSTGSCSSNVTFSASVTDNCPGASVTCSPASSSAFATGTTPVTCIATDAAGNTNTCSFSVTVSDTEPPTVTCPANITVSASTGSCSSNVTFSASVTDNCPGASVTCSPASGSAFSTGVTTVTCTATDAAGNTNTCSFSVTVTDIEPPTVTCPANLSVTTSGGVCSSNVTFSASVTDNCPGASVTCSPASGSAFATGTTPITCTATDAAGNTNTCSFSITVADVQAPTLTCPANITVATPPSVSTNLSYSTVATDNCGAVTLSCVPASGSLFGKGTTTVTCTATDGAGNNATCSFAVTVNDLGPVCTVLLHYGFEETAGLTALDFSGYGNHGLLTNGPLRTNGVVGRALRVDGVNDLVLATNPAALQVTGDLTMGCWMRPVTIKDSRYLLIKGNDANDRFSYALRVVNAKVQYRWVDPAGIRSIYSTANDVLVAGRWTHVAVTHTPGSSPRFYINGVAVPGTLAGGSLTALRGPSAFGFAVGQSADRVSPFNGTLDEVFVSSSILAETDLRSLTNGVIPCPRPALAITSASALTAGQARLPYVQTLTATGGKPPYLWTLASGTLPAGLALDAASGVLSGTAANVATNTFRIAVTDAEARTTDQEVALAILAPPPPVITSVSPFATGMVGRAYSRPMTVSSPAGPFSWHVIQGSLPAGLVLDAASGLISGTPTAAGLSTFRVEVADTFGQTGWKELTLTVEPTPTYVVCYDFEEASGTTALDKSGNGNHGTLLNGPVRVSGLRGNALQFDGVNDRVNGGNASSLNHTGALTLAAWILPRTNAGNRVILIKGNNSSTSQYAWMLRASAAKLQYRWVSPGGRENRLESVNSVIRVGEWMHVAVVHRPGSQPVFYTNGVAIAGTVTSGSASAGVTVIANPFTVGASSDGTQPFIGLIDETAFCSAALSAAGIGNLMQPVAAPAAAARQALAGTAIPVQLSLDHPAGRYLLRWNTEPGRAYQAQFLDPAEGTDWQNLSGVLPGTGQPLSVEDADKGPSLRWYRIRLVE